MRNQAYIALVALVTYIAAIITLSTKCLDRQHQQNAVTTTLDRFQLISSDCTTESVCKRQCDDTELENYFKTRFHEEMQNLLNGNVTKYVMQIKVIQSKRMNDEFETKKHAMEKEFETKISSVETANQQRLLEMKKQYDDENNNNILFPADRVGNYAVNMARVSRESFNTSFFSSQFGFEFMESYKGVMDLLLLYGDDTIPSNFSSYTNGGNGKNTIPYIDDAAIATENCDELRVVFISQHRQMKQCLAIVPNLESFHVYPIVRPSKYEDPSKRTNLIIDHAQPFQFKSRYHRIQLPFDELLPPPRFQQETKVFLKYLQNYLNSVETVLQELKTILSKIAIDNQVIIMMCNYGQAVLLNNFICTAQSRNINLSNLIVFTTDQEVTDLVTAFGLTAYYDQGRFGEHPKAAAARFGDEVFRDMAMGKIRAAQLVSVLGYDFLFQDVDVVWFKSPLEYFRNHNHDSFDMYFQKDGLVSKYNTPFGVNTGLYYVRNNDLTQYFFTSLLLNGDTMFRSHNDQEDIGVKLADFSSVYGLKVKVIPRTEITTPGGYQFHDVSPFGKDYMKLILNKTQEPYVFHMSWTDGKAHKIQYFQQMGQWYVNEECIDKTFDEIVAGASSTKKSISVHCCSSVPIVRCHYRDKPSVIPCSEHPPIENGAPSWW